MICENCKSDATNIRMVWDKDTKNFLSSCENCSDRFHNNTIGSDEITAVFTDNSGKTYAVNKKGNVVDSSKYRDDPRGWKYAGKTNKNKKYF